MNHRPGPSSPDRRLLALSVGLIFCALLILFQVGVKVQADQEEDDFYKYADIFSEVYTIIGEKYVEEVEPRTLFEGALNGMFLTLDQHSQFMNPDSLKQLEKDTEGEFSGIGIHISIRDGVLTVVAPIPGSPSAKLGIRSWDRIIEIEGKSTEGISIMDAVKKLTGPPGTQVSITIYRKGEPDPLFFTITRANIKINSIYNMMIGSDIGYIRMTKFSEETAADMKTAILKLKKEGARALIVDLRFNSGGLLNVVVDLSDYFVPKGEVIVSTKGRVPSQNKIFKAENDPIWDMPLAVLINHGSASASEILTGAIKDHKLGVIVGPEGQSTFGKGSVQTIEELENTIEWDEDGNPQKCALRITTARYYTPGGTSIDKVGISPDIEIPIPEGHEADLASRGLLGDPDMNEPAVILPREKSEDDPTSETQNSLFYLKNLEEKKTEKPFVDVQLQETVKIMKAYLLMSGNTARK